MNAIHSQVRRARRRLVLGRFLATACRTLGAAWAIAVVGMLIPTIWVVPWDLATWHGTWFLGCTVLGLFVAVVRTVWSAPSLVSVATEVDFRFSLRERLSSVLALSPEASATPIARALVSDAEKQAESLDLRDRFPIGPQRLAWLPILPAAMMALAWFAPAAVPESSQTPPPETTAEVRQVVAATESLKQKLRQNRERAEQAGLQDAEELFRKLETELGSLTSKPAIDSKEAMVALNDIKKQLDQRRDQLGAPEQLRQTLAKLPEFDTGPMQDLAKAIREGNLAKAEQQLRSLAERLRDENLSQEQREALRNQIETLRDRLNQEKQRTEQAIRQTEQQLQRARAEGRTEDEAKLRQQLAQLEARHSQDQSMQAMSDALDQAAQALQAGQVGQASDAIDALADRFGEMSSELDEWQGLEETLQSLAQSKQSMRCESCSGGGCSHCQPSAQEGGQEPGQRLSNSGQAGPGVGQGTSDLDGPEETPDASTYDSQVRGEPKGGPGITAGFVDGPNRKGVSREEVKSAVLNAVREQSDALENQTLPRIERDHAREYFDRLRQGVGPRETP